MYHAHCTRPPRRTFYAFLWSVNPGDRDKSLPRSPSGPHSSHMCPHMLQVALESHHLKDVGLERRPAPECCLAAVLPALQVSGVASSPVAAAGNDPLARPCTAGTAKCGRPVGDAAACRRHTWGSGAALLISNDVKRQPCILRSPARPGRPYATPRRRPIHTAHTLRPGRLGSSTAALQAR